MAAVIEVVLLISTPCHCYAVIEKKIVTNMETILKAQEFRDSVHKRVTHICPQLALLFKAGDSRGRVNSAKGT